MDEELQFEIIELRESMANERYHSSIPGFISRREDFKHGFDIAIYFGIKRGKALGRAEAFEADVKHILATAEKYDAGLGHGHALVRCAREIIDMAAQMEREKLEKLK
jgi:hypothetical protein